MTRQWRREEEVKQDSNWWVDRQGSGERPTVCEEHHRNAKLEKKHKNKSISWSCLACTWTVIKELSLGVRGLSLVKVPLWPFDRTQTQDHSPDPVLKLCYGNIAVRWGPMDPWRGKRQVISGPLPPGPPTQSAYLLPIWRRSLGHGAAIQGQADRPPCSLHDAVVVYTLHCRCTYCFYTVCVCYRVQYGFNAHCARWTQNFGRSQHLITPWHGMGEINVFYLSCLLFKL